VIPGEVSRGRGRSQALMRRRPAVPEAQASLCVLRCGSCSLIKIFRRSSGISPPPHPVARLAVRLRFGNAAGIWDGVHKIQYKTSGGARATTHYFSRTFENAVWHAHAVYQACEPRPTWRPT